MFELATQEEIDKLGRTSRSSSTAKFDDEIDLEEVNHCFNAFFACNLSFITGSGQNVAHQGTDDIHTRMVPDAVPSLSHHEGPEQSDLVWTLCQ